MCISIFVSMLYRTRQLRTEQKTIILSEAFLMLLFLEFSLKTYLI
jgi:hypothetical protein